MMQSAGFRASMSRRADCYDNAPMESFFHTLKTELVHHQHYATRDHVMKQTRHLCLHCKRGAEALQIICAQSCEHR